MKITLELFSVLREKLPPELKGKTVLHLDDGSSINDVLIKLDIKRKVVISVNGEQVSDRHYQLNDGDEVKLFSSISGG